MTSLSIASAASSAFLFLKANGASHAVLGPRALGGINSDIRLAGRSLRRTWSLLAAPASSGDTSLALLHDPSEMGWRIGDRLVLAPTTQHNTKVPIPCQRSIWLLRRARDQGGGGAPAPNVALDGVRHGDSGA